jgi:lipase (class 3)
MPTVPQDPTDQQHVFTLSWLSSTASAQNLNKTQLQAAIDLLDIPSFKWTVVWGPHYHMEGGVAANTMFVVQKLDDGGQPVYVVVVAGTNAASTYDLFTEDLDITPVPWSYATSTTNPQVTKGDNDGLSKLLAMPDFLDLQDLGLSLGDFLSKKISNPKETTLWFTGHSLGGALAPMLMLALMDPNSTLRQKYPNIGLSQWQQVNLLATAGPSIGNKAFVDYFKSVFNNPDSNATTVFIWNGNDVVPHAWNYATMQALTSPSNIYGVTFPKNSCVAPLIANQQGKTPQPPQDYVLFADSTFTHPLQDYAKNENVSWSEDAKFMAQLGFQHLNAYLDYFGCTWFTQPDPCADPFSADVAAMKLCFGKGSDTKAEAAAAPAAPAEVPAAV